MKIKIVFDIGIDERNAIADYYGEERPADYETAKAYIEDDAYGNLELATFSMKEREKLERQNEC